jgi:hypothetical protein
VSDGGIGARHVIVALLPVPPDDTVIRYYWNRLVAWMTAGQYVHSELIFEDGKSFGLTTDGIQWRNAKCMRKTYDYTSLTVSNTQYSRLYEKCQSAANTQQYTCSTAKAVIAQCGPVGRMIAWCFPRKYSYCSEILIRLMVESNIDIGLSPSAASPNDIGKVLDDRGRATVV